MQVCKINILEVEEKNKEYNERNMEKMKKRYYQGENIRQRVMKGKRK